MEAALAAGAGALVAALIFPCELKILGEVVGVAKVGPETVEEAAPELDAVGVREGSSKLIACVAKGPELSIWRVIAEGDGGGADA